MYILRSDHRRAVSYRRYCLLAITVEMKNETHGVYRLFRCHLLLPIFVAEFNRSY